MITDENIIAEVIEAYAHDKNQVVVARNPDMKTLLFFFLPKHPDINFGDTLVMNFKTSRYWVHHGNPNLTYRIFPLEFPGTLLLELIDERMQLED